MMDFRAWRNGAREREKSSAAHRTRTLIPSVIDFTAVAFNQQPNLFVEDNLERDPTYEDVELIPPPIRRRRRRRGVAPAIVNVG